MIITPASHVIARSSPITLGPIDTSPGTARASARAQLSAWGRDELADDLEIVVSDLMSNAVAASEPGGTPVALRMVLTTASVLVEVWDCAPGVPAPRAPHAESGGAGASRS